MIGYITSDAVPPGYLPPPGVIGPMPAKVATMSARPISRFAISTTPGADNE
jgi:hypothetical protein